MLLAIGSLLVAASTACSSPAAEKSGCSTDFDCKDARVCEAGQCVGGGSASNNGSNGNNGSSNNGATNNGVSNNGADNNGTTNNGTVVGAPASLHHVTIGCEVSEQCDLRVDTSTSLPLAVRVVDDSGTPVSDVSVAYSLYGGETESSLGAATSLTNSDGVAEVTFAAGPVAGTAEIEVSVASTDDVTPIRFALQVAPPGSSRYVIQPDVPAEVSFDHIVARAFGDGTSCADVVANREAELRGDAPSLTAAVQVTATDVGAAPVAPIMIPAVPSGASYTVELQGYRAESPAVEAFYGCTDQNPAANGEDVVVDVALDRVAPRLAGTFDVTHRFTLDATVCAPDGAGGYLGPLAPAACEALALLANMPVQPGQVLSNDGSSNPESMLERTVGLLPDGTLKDAITSFLINAFTQDVSGSILNDFFQEWIDNEAPAWVRNTVNLPGDIFETLSSFGATGTLTLDATGTTVHRLDALVFDWTGNCPAGDATCRARTVSTALVGDGDIDGGFAVSLRETASGDWVIDIPAHVLGVSYSEIVLAFFERVFLPSTFGDQTVTSFDAAFAKLLSASGGTMGCVAFGDWIDDNIGGGGNVTTSMCNSLLTGLSSAVELYLDSFASNAGAPGLTLSSTGCVVREPTSYPQAWENAPRPYIDSIGSDQPGLECEWTLSLEAGPAPSNVASGTGTVSGSRSSF